MVERVCEMADAFLRHLQKIAAASQNAAKLAVVCTDHLVKAVKGQRRCC